MLSPALAPSNDPSHCTTHSGCWSTTPPEEVLEVVGVVAGRPSPARSLASLKHPYRSPTSEFNYFDDLVARAIWSRGGSVGKPWTEQICCVWGHAQSKCLRVGQGPLHRRQVVLFISQKYFHYNVKKRASSTNEDQLRPAYRKFQTQLFNVCTNYCYRKVKQLVFRLCW